MLTSRPKFAIGSIVRLRSNPEVNMTVANTLGNMVTTVWMSELHVPTSYIFHEDMLREVSGPTS